MLAGLLEYAQHADVLSGGIINMKTSSPLEHFGLTLTRITHGKQVTNVQYNV